MVFNIQTQNGALDVFNQDISWEWTNIRFAEGLKDSYSTDMEIPKTNNNCAILGISGLLDSTQQLFGTHLTPCVLSINNEMMDIYLQVVSINEDTITICLYQRTLPDKVFGKMLRSFCHDDINTIWVWSVNTLTAYPQAFPTYNYGNMLRPNLAMRHPTRKLNDVINDINSTLQDFTLPTVYDSLMLMGAQKKVCPQNSRQVIEFASTGNSHNLVLAGGQHITNDLDGWDGHSKVMASSTTEFTFNRSCTATIHGYVSWGREITTGLNTFLVSIMRNGVFEYGWQINTTNLGRRNGLVQSTITMAINSGDIISMRIDSPTTNNAYNKFQLLCGVLDIEYSDYAITDDDYGTDLVYCYRHPTLKQWFPDNTIYEHPFDGRTEDFYIYNWDGSLNLNDTFSMSFPWRGISYIGYWCNIGDITLKELYFGLCWMYEQKPKRELRTMQLIPANATTILENAVVSEIRPSSDKLGQTTNVTWSDSEHPETLVNIDNVWLSETVTRHESPFVYVEIAGGGQARVRQYTITSSYDEDGKTVWECEYEEPEGAVLLTYGQYGRLHRWGLLPPPPISKMGIDKLTQCMEVEMKSFDNDVADKDFIYYNGRKFMVVEGSTDLNTKESTITALLIPTKDTIIEFLPTQRI